MKEERERSRRRKEEDGGRGKEGGREITCGERKN